MVLDLMKEILFLIMKPFKFFSNNKPFRSRWLDGNILGEPKWVGMPIFTLFYLHYFGGVDPIDNHQTPTINYNTRSKCVRVSTYVSDSYQSFLDEHSNHYIWIYGVISSTEVYTEENIHELPIGERVFVRAHIEIH